MRQNLPCRRIIVCLPVCSKELRYSPLSCGDNPVSVQGNGLLPLWSSGCDHSPYTVRFRIVPCPFWKAGNVVSRIIVSSLFVCNIKFDTWRRGGRRMVKVHIKGTRRTAGNQQYGALPGRKILSRMKKLPLKNTTPRLRGSCSHFSVAAFNGFWYSSKIFSKSADCNDILSKERYVSVFKKKKRKYSAEGVFTSRSRC